MLFFSKIQIYRTVDPGSGIPPAVWLVGISCDHTNGIFRAVTQKIIQFHINIYISVRTERCFFPIDIDLCIVIYPFKFQNSLLVRILFRDKKALYVFIISTDVPADISLSPAFLCTWLTSHSIMGKRDFFLRFFPCDTSAGPVFIKIYFFHPSRFFLFFSVWHTFL